MAQFLAIMGTSTCHVVNSTVLADVPGICGVVDGGIIEGSFGYEAGQSAVGDIFAWWLRTGVPAEYEVEATERGESIHDLLSRKSAELPVGGHGLVALDWMGGNRSILVDHDLSGVVVGLTLATRPEEVYRALMEATAFGTRVIIETFERAGIPITEFIVAGGLKRNAVLLQLYADILRRPISIAGSDQAPAVGSAIPCGRRRGRLPGCRQRRGGDGAGRAGRLPAGPGARRHLRRALRRVPSSARPFRWPRSPAIRLRRLRNAALLSQPEPAGVGPVSHPCGGSRSSQGAGLRAPRGTGPVRPGRVDLRQTSRPGCRARTSSSSKRRASAMTI